MSEQTYAWAKRLLGGEGRARAEAIQAFFNSHGLADTTQVQAMLQPERIARMASGLPDVERMIADNEVIRWGENEWTALETNGHAEGHLCLSNPALRILISGDQVKSYGG